MKKLMIALTAAAAGLFASTAAADEPSVTTYDHMGFEALESGTTLDTSSDAKWVVDSEKPPAKLLVTAVGDRTLPYGVEYPATGEGNEVNYLDVKTDMTAPIYRDGFKDQTLADTVFFDSLVKFTATDTDPVATDYDVNSKIILYVKDNSEDDTSALTTTNLYALSKDSAGAPVAYDLGTIDVETWHRVTIKAIKAANNGAEIAFVVYVDQMARQYSNTVTAFDTSKLTLAGKGLNAAKKLIPSLVAATSVTGVGFAGQGQIDDLVFCDSVGTWADEATFTLAKSDANITAFTYTAKDSSGETLFTGNQDSPAMTYVEGMKVVLDTVEFAAGTWELSVEGDNIVYDPANKTITVGSPNAVATLVANDATPRVSVTIGEETVTYPSIGAALAAVGENTATLLLNENITLGTVSMEGVDVSEATILGNVTLDLGGKTITGPAGYAGYVIENAGALTIKDSVGGGKIAPVAANAGAVYTLGALTVEGGTFDGAVIAEDTGTIAAITGGKFSVKPDYSPAEGKAWKQDADEYWYIADADRAQIGENTYATLGEAIKAAKDGDTITLLMNSEEGGTGFAIGVSKYPVSGLTIDLNKKTLTFNADAAANADNVKDCMTIQTNNIVTIKNGTIAVAETGANGKATAFRDVIRYYAHADYNTLNLNGVTFDCENIPLTDSESHPIAPLQIEGGNVTFTNVAFDNVAEGGYTLKIGNHANQVQYKMGTYTFDDATAGNLEGNVLIAGGRFVGAEKFAESDATFFYGKNTYSSWDDTAYAPFAARYGKVLADAKGAEDLQLGQLFFSADDAVEAYGDAKAGDELVVYGTLTATEENSVSIEVAAVKADAIVGADNIYLVQDGPALVTKTTGLETVLPPEDEDLNEIKASEPDADGWITYTCVEKQAPQTGIKPGETVGLGNGSMTPEQAQIEADKLPIVLTAEDEMAGLTTESLCVKAELIGGAWQAVVDVKPELAPAVDATAETPIEVGAENFSATVKNPVKGLYYYFTASATVDGTYAPAGDAVRAGDTGVTLTAPKGGAASFYKLNAAVRPPVAE